MPTLSVSPWWFRKTAEELAEPAEPCLEELSKLSRSDKRLEQLIRTTVPSLHGWCSVEKAHALASIVLARKPTCVLEIGVWAGRSLLPMAWAAQMTGNCKVIGVDAWNARVSADEEYPGNAEWWAAQDHEAIYKLANKLVQAFGLGQIVTLVRRRSDDFEPVPCQVLHIDGSHVETAVRDATRFGPMVPLGGIAVLDDIQWVGGSVLRAIDVLQELGFVERFRFTEQNWNIMQKCK